MSNAFSPDRYQVWAAEKGGRHAYRWTVIDTERKGNPIVVRTASKESAESIAKQLNEKGLVESV
jgi:preprotein translocase subunit SecA